MAADLDDNLPRRPALDDVQLPQPRLVSQLRIPRPRRLPETLTD
jgi:hypothetical protein